MKKDEKSERALDLTSEAIDCNPANYSVWYNLLHNNVHITLYSFI